MSRRVRRPYRAQGRRPRITDAQRRAVIKQYRSKRYTQVQIAADVGISQSSVCRIISEAP